MGMLIRNDSDVYFGVHLVSVLTEQRLRGVGLRIICLTRLETRTKESNLYASYWMYENEIHKRSESMR